MTSVFADTAFYVALTNPRDGAHRVAVRASRNLRRRVVTTEFVLVELANALSKSESRPAFLAILEQIRNDPDTQVIALSQDLLNRGLDLYSRRLDKDWSLTDCTSFVVMSDQSVRDALTTDHHFAQAGFRALLA